MSHHDPPQPTRFRHVVDGPSDILVVCHANITRSPLFAAMLARALGPLEVTVGSAGVRAFVDSAADPGSVDEAVVRGLALDHHRARQVDIGLLRPAKLVLTMAEAQRDECVGLTGRAAMNMFTVPEAVRLATFVGPVALSDGIDRLVDQWNKARPLAPFPDGPEDVRDPHGGPARGYVRLAMQLDQSLAAILGEVPSDAPG